MEEHIVKVGFIAEGTTCDSCAKIITSQALKVDGVKEASFDLSTETGYAAFDKEKTNIDAILYKIEEKGYKCFILDENKRKNNLSKYYGLFIGLIGILVAGYFIISLFDKIALPQISQNMGYGLLFLVGILTGFHCISMCGGFVLSYTVKNAHEGKNSHKSHLFYGIGKTASYTLIGAVFGLIGSIIAFTPIMRGVAGVLAGLFLMLFGLRMLNVFPILRKIQFKTPEFIEKAIGKSSHSGPLVTGLLNGLMIACGPLQAIYIMAAGTGSMIEGAKLLFIFAVGTLPVMMGFGYFASYLSSKMTQKIVKASGAIVLVLGLIMLNNGLVLTGTGYDFGSLAPFASGTNNINIGIDKASAVVGEGYQEIRMDVTSSGWEPDAFVLKKGVPVRWIINGKELNSCNNAIQVPKLGLKFNIRQGEQVIEFTPTEEGTIRWSCWMGMIQGTFIVKNNVDLNNKEELQKEISSLESPKSSSGTCSMKSGSGCGCGMMG